MKKQGIREKAEHKATISLYPLIELFSQLGKVRRHSGSERRIITAGILSAAIIIAALPFMSMTAFAASPTPLTLTAETDGSSVTFDYVSGSDVMYKLGDGDWTDYTKSTSVSLDKNETVSFRGTDVKTDYDKHFSMTGRIAASGDVTSLTNRVGGDVALTDMCYMSMFADCTSLETAPALPATALAYSCYYFMFGGCTSLKAAPELPATVLAAACYYCMFSGCSSLEAAPELPATELTEFCYMSIFNNCTSLSTAPELPASKLANNCYDCMFYGCTSLEAAPELPATELADYCYNLMFKGCTSLKVSAERTDGYTKEWRIPAEGTITATTYNWNSNMLLETGGTFKENPATGTVYYIFEYRPLVFKAEADDSSVTFDYKSGSDVMYKLGNGAWTTYTKGTPVSLDKNETVSFRGTDVITDQGNHFSMTGRITASGDVTALTNGVGGNANLTAYCYRSMFYDCTSLETAPALPATTLADSCYYSMFGYCTSLTAAPELPATSLADNCYSDMFKGCTALKVSTEKTGDYTKEWRIPSKGAIILPVYGWNTDMLSGTGGTFTADPDVGTTYYIYVDHTPPVISGIVNGKTYCETAEFTVTDDAVTDTVKVNGKKVTASDGNYTLTDSGTNTVIATDKTGNSTTVTVTLNASHTYDNDCDTTCNFCNETRTITHSYGTEWSFDGADHWHECSVCGDKTDVDAHTPEEDDGDCTTAVHCSVCNAVTTEAQSHDFSEKITDAAHLKSAATYTSPAVYYYDCSHCSSIDLTHTYESGTTLIDTTAPTGEIKISTNSFKAFINSITFGLFFKESQTVTVTGEDAGIGLDKIYYFKSETALGTAAVEALDADRWAEGGTFSVFPDWKGVIYAKITDKSGNALYISSDGLVFDATSPVIMGVTDGGEYCITATVLITEENPATVKLDGEDVTLTEGKFTVFAKDGTQQIVVTDKAGNVTSATITVYAGHTWDDGAVTVEPTVTAKGVKTYTCTACGETKTEEIPMLAPSIIEGGSGTYQKGSNGYLTFISNAAFTDFESVSVDGEIIDSADYTVEEGGTVITLTADYLDTLSVGTHTLSVKSASGTASAEFTVTAEADNPPTGDTVLWIAFMLLTGGLLTILCITKKRRTAYSKQP